MITIITTCGIFTLDHDNWGRDKRGDVHVYSDDDTTKASFDAENYVATLPNTDKNEAKEILSRYNSVRDTTTTINQ